VIATLAPDPMTPADVEASRIGDAADEVRLASLYATPSTQY
jgi:hypothetical protein